MKVPPSSPLGVGLAALIAQLLLQVAWHTTAPSATAGGLLLVVTVVPLLPALWVARNNLRRGILIGGIVSLLYFCHGVVSVWADPPARGFGWLELALSLVVIAALGWGARNYRRGRPGQA